MSEESIVPMTRRALADDVDGCDDQITALQNAKRELYDTYRGLLSKAGYKPAAAKAVLLHRKGSDRSPSRPRLSAETASGAMSGQKPTASTHQEIRTMPDTHPAPPGQPSAPAHFENPGKSRSGLARPTRRLETAGFSI
jgi:hypothetical protein